jgi:hypothetical protein
MAPLFAALRKNSLAALGLHSCAETMLLMSAAHMRLERAFRQIKLLSPRRRMKIKQVV